MHPTLDINSLIQQLAATLSKQTDDLLVSELGLSHSQYRVLLALEWNPRAQQKTIAAYLNQTEASISRQIKLLTLGKFITITQDPANRRVHIIAVTPLGMQQTEAATAMIRRLYESTYGGIGAARLQSLTRELQALQKSLRSSSK